MAPHSPSISSHVVALATNLRQGADAGGDKPTDVPICDMGPQIDEIQFKKIMSYIEPVCAAAAAAAAARRIAQIFACSVCVLVGLVLCEIRDVSTVPG